MRKLRSLFLDLILVVAALASLTATYLAISQNIHFVKVVSNSMAPLFHKGDTLVVRTIPAESLKVGEIPILPSVTDSGVLFSHRIVEKSDSASGVEVRTKGDANPLIDDWSYLITSRLVPIYLWRLPTASIPILPPNKSVTYLLFFILVTVITGPLISNLISNKSKD